MSYIVGIDGCPSAWFAILLDTITKKTQFEVVTDLSAFYDRHQPIAVGIDIPIGLTDSGPRECDAVARRLLKPRGSCVFPAPIRPALSTFDRASAHAISFSVQGKGVAAQAFGIYPKVREVDELLQARPELRDVFNEVHPELSFCAWNEDQVVSYPKKTAQGFMQRLGLVQGEFGEAAFEAPRAMFTRKRVSDDDILDAYAALWTAIRIRDGRARRCPEEQVLDSAGLPMVIWY